MIRFRILALLTVVGSALLFRWTWFIPPAIENLEPSELITWLWLFAGLASPFMVFTGAMLFILSFVAIRPINGEYVIRRSSIYGKVFKFFAFGDEHQRSYCVAFWRTNVILFCLALAGVLLSVLVAIIYDDWTVIFKLGLYVLIVFVAFGLFARVVVWYSSTPRRKQRMFGSRVRVPRILNPNIKVLRWMGDIVEDVAESNFAFTLRNLYRKTLCPRIRVE